MTRGGAPTCASISFVLFAWCDPERAQAVEEGRRGGGGVSWKFEDLRNDCEARGKAFKWVYARDTGKPGACLKYGSQVRCK